MSIRARLSRVEGALSGRRQSTEADAHAILVAQLDGLTDEELDRLEAIHLRSVELAGCSPLIPEECGLDLRAFIAFVDKRPDEYYAAVASYQETRQ